MAGSKHRLDVSDLERRVLAQLVEMAQPPRETWVGLVQVFYADEVRQLPALLDGLRRRLAPRLRVEVTDQ